MRKRSQCECQYIVVPRIIPRFQLISCLEQLYQLNYCTVLGQLPTSFYSLVDAGLEINFSQGIIRGNMVSINPSPCKWGNLYVNTSMPFSCLQLH